MSTISKRIELYLKLLLNKSEDNIVEIQRNALAEHFKCVPSQINYVLSTRFSTDQGYCIETKRGGGGFVRIKKMDIALMETLENLALDKDDDESLLIDNVDLYIDRLQDEELLSHREGYLLKNVFSSSVFENLPEEEANPLKSLLLKDILKAIINM